MKTAKEWAESVVSEPVLLDQRMWNVSLIDDQAPPGISLIEPSDEEDAHDLCSDARSIIERLVERAQGDARAPLAREVEQLRDENAAMRQQLVDAERTIEALRADRRRDIEAMDVLADCVSDNVWNELSEVYPTLVESVNALIQRATWWRAEQRQPSAVLADIAREPAP